MKGVHYPHKETFRLSPMHVDALRRLARSDGESRSAVVRRVIREEAERQGCWLSVDVKRDWSDLGT